MKLQTFIDVFRESVEDLTTWSDIKESHWSRDNLLENLIM